MENLTPQQLEDYDNAVSLAWLANEAFDERKAAATSVSVHNNTNDFLDSFAQVDQEFELLWKAASVLMPPLEAFKDSEPSEPLASESVWSAMTPEQKTRANEVRSAIAERFKDHAVTAESLQVVMTESEDGKKIFTLLHTGNGVDIGDHRQEYDNARSNNSVMSKKNNPLFKVEVNGRVYDTRSGMTDAAYDALYAEAKADEGITLPDSQKASEEFGDLWTWTMLTGEPLTAAGIVQVRRVYDDRVYRSVCHPGDGVRSLRVRPAVVIE